MEHLDPDVLAAIVDGRLPSLDVARAERHLDACATCRKELSALAGMADRTPPHLARGDAAADTVQASPSRSEANTGEAFCATCGKSFAPGTTHCPDDGAALVRLAGRASWTGRVLDSRFVIGERIAEGGMGAVYTARQLSVDREVAIKMIRPSLVEEHDVAKRFLREARLASRLVAPGIVAIYDFGQTSDGTLYLVMELLRGKTLGAVVADGPSPAARVAKIALQLCDALHAAHSQDIVHRDLKPGNVMILDEPAGADFVKVLDFGLAKSIDGESTTGITATRAVLGTPMYMAPEQIAGDRTDARTDLYALGCILHEMLTGQPPFSGTSARVLMAQHESEPPPALPPEVPRPLAAVVERLLAKAPSARFQSAAEVRAALAPSAARDPAAARARTEPAASSEPPRRRPVAVLLALGGVLAAGAGVAAYVATHGDSSPPDRVAPVQRPPAITLTPAPTTLPAKGPIQVFAVNVERVDNAVVDNTFDGMVQTTLRRSSRIEQLGGPDLTQLARELAIHGDAERLMKAWAERDHIPVIVVKTTLTPKGEGFTIASVATDARTGARVYATTLEVPQIGQLPEVTTRLVSGLREALGEKLGDDERVRPGLSANIDAVLEYQLGRAQEGHDLPRTIEHYEKAIALDPVFPLAHVQLSIAYYNADRREDARAQQQLVLHSLDKLGERDRLIFLGDYYFATTGEFDRAADAYKQLLATWPTDGEAETNLPLAYEALHDIRAALATARLASKHHPRLPHIRAKECYFLVESGAFDEGLQCTQRCIDDFPQLDQTVYSARLLAAALLGKRAEVSDALAKLEKDDLSSAIESEADLAISEGRWHAAEQMLTRGIATDLAGHAADRVAAKRALLAELRLAAGDRNAARTLASQVPVGTPGELTAALVLAGSQDQARATAAAAHYGTGIAASERLVGKMIEGELLRARGEPTKAMIVLGDALRLDNDALAHLLLARAALDAKHFADAYSELQTCLARRGDLAGMGLRYDALVLYELAKAREGLGTADTEAAYRAFLDRMHDPDADDPLVIDARKHVH